MASKPDNAIAAVFWLRPVKYDPMHRIIHSSEKSLGLPGCPHSPNDEMRCDKL
jgi:hypothetical protein